MIGAAFLYLMIPLVPSTPLAASALAQSIDIPPQDSIPAQPQDPVPDRPPDLPENPEELLPTPPTLPDAPTVPPERLETTFFITDISFQGNTIFDSETLNREIGKTLTPADPSDFEAPVPTWTPRLLTVSQLVALSQAVSDLYAKAGYPASGALVEIPLETQRLGRGAVVFQVQEGAVTSPGWDKSSGCGYSPQRRYSSCEVMFSWLTRDCYQRNNLGLVALAAYGAIVRIVF